MSVKRWRCDYYTYPPLLTPFGPPPRRRMRTQLGLVEGGGMEMRAEVVVTNQWGTSVHFCESSEDSTLFEFTMRMR
eukprot:4423976-Pyramimonas_sp.AAC.1